MHNYLTVIQPNLEKTCFGAHLKFRVNCTKKKCDQWIKHPEGHNCVFIAANNRQHTLQEIGEIYGVSRMRICQIEKEIFEQIKLQIK